MGTWRYEIGNMDHAVQMGTELAAQVLKGVPEQLFTRER
jgi:hypothetical protein